MPAPKADSVPPSHVPPSFPSAAETHILPVHRAQYEQNLYAAHRRARSQGDVELQDLESTRDTPESQNSSAESSIGHKKLRKNLAPPLHGPASASSSSPPENAHLLDPSEFSDDEDATDAYYPETPNNAHNNQMGKKGRHSRSPQPPPSSASRPDTLSSANGSARGVEAMNGLVEHRRKHASLDSPTSQRDSLMGQHSFSLDDPVPAMTHDADASSKGFFELPKQDQSNFLLLVLLYFLQGIPMGLATGSVPFLLKSHVSYTEIGVFSLASYPYSLKLLWSPIVDAVWSPKLGRRKSWILPIQTISGFAMLWLGGRVQEMMTNAEAKDGGGVWSFTWWWFALVFLCATQDIAVDGWALTLLSHENLSYASTAQTVGLTAGQFLSYTVFLAFNSKDFANRWFRPTNAPLDVGLMTLDGYLKFWGWAYLIVTLGLGFMKKEERTRNTDGIWDVYKVMGGILKLKNIQTFIVIHLIAKIGFQANDGVTNLKLLDKGFSQEDLALTVLIDFPFEIALGYYAGKWCQTYPPMKLWSWAFIGRLGAAVFAQFVVMIFPSGVTPGHGVPTWYLLTVIVEHVYSTFMNTTMFVAISAFHARIADPVIGGTYMTLLATVSNLGGTFPRFFILKFVDIFTAATCIPPTNPPPDLKSPITSTFSCALEADKHRCKDGGGTCNITTDGYYVMNVVCVIIGLVTFLGFIRPAAMKLQALPLKAWRMAS